MRLPTKLITMLTGGWRNVPQPDAAFSWLPFSVQQSGRTFRAAGWTIDQNRPTGNAYYVKTTGSDAAAGTAWATALRSVKAAFQKSDVDVIYIEAGVYTNNYGFVSTNPTRSISFIAYGGPVYLANCAEVTWAADGDAYKATRSAVLKVADATNLDAYGDWTFLTNVADTATCQATPNSWYSDGTYLWVRTFDSRTPTTTIRPYFTSGNYVGLQNTGNTTCYYENIHFEGGILGGVSVGNASNPVTAYFKDCSFKYGSSNGLASIASGITYCQNCVAAKNGDDGFNYHKNTGAIPYAVEIDCTGRDNGLAGDNDNASTMHDGGIIVRINGEYMRCVGRVIHDVTTGTKSWMLGSYVHDSTSAAADCNYGLGSTTDAAEMWLDSCRSTGSLTDIEVVANSTCRIRNFDGGGVYIGTPVAY